MQFENLFKPIKIGAVEIKNRIVLAPMNVHMSDGKGYISDQDICFHVARAKGGVGLNVLACVLTSPRAAANQKMMILHLLDQTHVRGMGDLTNAVHSAGGKIFVQLSPGFGRQSRASWTDTRAPSAVPCDLKKLAESAPKGFLNYAKYLPKTATSMVYPAPMTTDEIKGEEDNFVKSAELAAVAGFDGIELHSCHGYLIHQFFSPRTNRRDDAYGGSLENRTRFAVNIIAKTRRALGSDLPISVRLSGAEHVEGGVTAEDVREIAKMLVQAGADCINLSDGCYEALKYFMPEQNNVHILEEQGKKLKNAVKVPIISFSINDPIRAEKAIADGETDMISMGRQLLADPNWANKVREGKIEDIVLCDRDNFCSFTILGEGTIHCIKNPDLGRERFMPEYWPQRVVAKVPETLKRLRLGERQER